jgi:hypothetical protein
VEDPDNKQRRGGRLSTPFFSSFGVSRFLDIKLFVVSVFLMSLIVFLLSLTRTCIQTALPLSPNGPNMTFPIMYIILTHILPQNRRPM